MVSSSTSSHDPEYFGAGIEETSERPNFILEEEEEEELKSVSEELVRKESFARRQHICHCNTAVGFRVPRRQRNETFCVRGQSHC